MLTLKPIRFDTRKTGVVLTGDTHFHHVKADFVWGPRGYESSVAHDGALVTRWNELVRPDDVVIHAGDFVLSDGDGVETNKLLSQLNGNIFYVNGNHNSGVRTIYRAALAQFQNVCLPPDAEIYPLTIPTLHGSFTFVGDLFACIIDGQEIYVSHFPLSTWENASHGSWNLCGHEHGHFTESRPEFLNAKRLDIGIDVFGEPVPFAKVRDIMLTKHKIEVGHHTEAA